MDVYEILHDIEAFADQLYRACVSRKVGIREDAYWRLREDLRYLYLEVGSPLYEGFTSVLVAARCLVQAGRERNIPARDRMYGELVTYLRNVRATVDAVRGPLYEQELD